MRRARPLYLLAIIFISAYLGWTYRQRMLEMARDAPKVPEALPLDVNATASDWHWEKSSGDGPTVSVKAKSFRQVKAPDRFELEKVDLKIYRKDGKTYDHILSDRAIFDMGEAFLYSDGEADITMGVAEGEEERPGRLIRIKSSGIKFDSKTGKAETEREATFEFERGSGRAVGALYDPSTKELLLRSKVELVWKDQGAVGKDKGPVGKDKGNEPRPMKVEAGEVVYKEKDSQVLLSPWAKLTRGNLLLEGKGALVFLDKSGIRRVETTEAKGSDKLPGKMLDYAADALTMGLNERSEVERIEGKGNASLVTSTEFAVTTTRANEVTLEFDATGKESELRKADAKGNTVVESKPVLRADRPAADTKILRSEVVEMKMRPGGREIETLDTTTPGVLEFIPNRAGQHRRRVDGDRFHVVYGGENMIESFRAVEAKTRSENEPRRGKPQPPALTWSKELVAQFAPRTGEMTRMEQWGDFRYEEGERKARAERALLEQASGRITLVQGARVSDATGSTNADQIVLDQKSEDFQADGNVTSSRLPDKKGAGSAMLSKEEATQARASRMNTFEKQTVVIYDGNAVVWQGSSRLQADKIEIDRKNSVLRANGNVVSQIQDQRKDAGKEKKGSPQFTLISAPAMTYSDKERMAHYTGGVSLRRGELDVKSRELRAYMKEEGKEKKKDNESSLEKAVADGAVVIVQSSVQRTRRGTSEHADYFVDEQKVVLERGAPQLDDSLKGTTRGNQLIYFSNDDRLLVNGVPTQPAVSKIRRK